MDSHRLGVWLKWTFWVLVVATLVVMIVALILTFRDGGCCEKPKSTSSSSSAHASCPSIVGCVTGPTGAVAASVGLGQISFGAADVAVETSGTEIYIGFGATTTNGATGILSTTVAADGVLGNLGVNISDALPADALLTFTIIHNGVPTALVVSLEEGATSSINTTDAVPVTIGDTVGLLMSASNFTATLSVSASVLGSPPS
jgi:hypothetical protein